MVGQVVAVVAPNDRLSVWAFEDPAIDYPVAVEVRIEFRQVRQEQLIELLVLE
jgi:hypothetical protein